MWLHYAPILYGVYRDMDCQRLDVFNLLSLPPYISRTRHPFCQFRTLHRLAVTRSSTSPLRNPIAHETPSYTLKHARLSDSLVNFTDMVRQTPLAVAALALAQCGAAAVMKLPIWFRNTYVSQCPLSPYMYNTICLQES